MYKVLLVDDEMFVRQGLRQLIDWESLDLMVAGEAENGEEAFAAIEQLKPDLIITDIRMPVLDGLELIKKSKEALRPDLDFIIISGYHDFKYAQQALRYGVHDYVLKPIDEHELTETLKKLTANLSKRRLEEINNKVYVSDTILEAVIHTQPANWEPALLEAVMRLEESAPFRYVLIEVHGALQDNRSQEIGLREVMAAAASVADDYKDLLFYDQQLEKYGLLLPERLAPEGAEQPEAFMRRLHNGLTKALGRSVTLYVGQSAELAAGIRLSYETANEAAQYKYAFHQEPILFYEQVKGTPLHYLDIDEDLYKQLMEQVEEQKPELFGKTLDAILQQFQYKRFSPSAVANAVTRCVIGISRVIQGMDGDENKLSTLGAITQWQQRNPDLKGLKKLLDTFMTEAAAYIACLRKDQSKGGIEKIKKFIETNYTSNISLKSIAAQFYMNPVYLGQLFRKTYGVYFNDFLLGIRVQEAKRLLRQTDMRMYEIAERVGFQNADYFVTQFEKLENVTPTEYRNKLIGK